MPFRDAYCVTGQLVNRCIALGTTLDALPLVEYRAFSPVFDEDVYAAIDLLTDPALLEAAKAEFAKQTAEGYTCPIPADAVPVVPD